MPFRAPLKKMRTAIGSPVNYSLVSEEGSLDLNPLLGKKVAIRFEGRIFCIACGRKTNKSFGQGFCYPCFANSPDNSECIVRPELCEGHLGGGRDPEWELAHHVQPHVVYLALSSGLKVGITRKTQVPTRWIDQGAVQAIILAEVPYRRLAGEIEVALKNHYSDRTSWQQMLKGLVAEEDLVAKKAEAASLLPDRLKEYVYTDNSVIEIEYPLLDTPAKVTSLKLDKQPLIEGVLTGIKGQYLMLDNKDVINIRSHAGYEVSWDF